jgi:starch phosphorylase
MDERLRPGSLNAVRFAASEGMVGYFSMEIAIEPSMPTYSGGLGVLAGDTLRSAADVGLPLAAVTLVHRKGYFQQSGPGEPASAGGAAGGGDH